LIRILFVGQLLLLARIGTYYSSKMTAYFLLFVALICPQVRAQEQPVAGSIAGVVSDATTGEGVRKATVYATLVERRVTASAGIRPQVEHAAITDDAGAFTLSSLRPGEYLLRADRSGFLTAAAEPTARVTVTASPDPARAQLKLLRQAAISGRVTDADGDPLERVLVQAIPARSTQAAAASVSPLAHTDDRGHFRIHRLPPGRYKLLATLQSPRHHISIATAPGEPALIEAPTYFPSSLDIGAASEITVASGDERTAVEIRLQKSPVVRVAGRLTGAQPGAPPPAISLSPFGLSGVAGSFRPWNTYSALPGPDGAFLFPNVLPGEYMLQCHQSNGQAHRAAGYIRVRVGQQDVEGVNLELLPLIRLTARATADDGEKLPSRGLNIVLLPLEPGFPNGPAGQVRSDGSFTVENLHRARYRVAHLSYGSGFYLKSVSVAGQPQRDLTIDLSAGETPIEFVFSNKPGAIEVTLPADVPASTVLALPVLPGDAPHPSAAGFPAAPVQANASSVTLNDVAPGEYDVVLAPRGAIELLSIPEVWAKARARAARVKVSERVTIPAAPRLLLSSDLDEN
jgi:protocatechuate 3,4-dioxygenase beta subunit